MYLIRYGGEFLHDPLSDERRVSGGTLSGDADDVPELSFTVPPSNPLLGSIAKRDLANPIVATYGGQELFRGFAEESSELLDGSVEVRCRGDLVLLSDTVVRPYSTDPAGDGYIGSSGFAALFQWLIDRHNDRVVCQGPDGSRIGYDRTFLVGYPPGSGTSLAQEGARLDARGGGSASSTSKPSTLEEIRSKMVEALDAHVEVWTDADGARRVALYADVPGHMENSQVLEFAVNMTDLTIEDSALDVRTAIVPEGGTDADGNAITLASLPDGPVSGGFVKRGDAIYSRQAVAIYGYREEAWSDTEAASAQELLASAAVRLQSTMSSSQGISVGALDLALVDDSRPHLLPGWKVPVQAAPRGIDLELVVSSCDIDFDDPDGTTYRLGTAETRITRDWNSIMKDVAAAGSAADDADRKASAAKSAANAAAEDAALASAKADGATAVTVQVQGGSSAQANALAGGEALFAPSEGIEVVEAAMASTGSMRQFSMSFTASSAVGPGGRIGTLSERPAMRSMLLGMEGRLDADGSIVATEGLSEGGHELSVVFVKEMQ